MRREDEHEGCTMGVCSNNQKGVHAEEQRSTVLYSKGLPGLEDDVTVSLISTRKPVDG